MGMTNQYAKWVQTVLATVLSASALAALSGCYTYGPREEYMARQAMVIRPVGWPTDDHNKPLPDDVNGAPVFPKSYSADEIEQAMEKFRAAQNWNASQMQNNFPTISAEIAKRRAACRSSR